MKNKIFFIFIVLLTAFFVSIKGRESAISIFKSEFGAYLLEENKKEQALKLSLMTDVEVLRNYTKK